MARQTSIDAYNTIKERGLLSQKRQVVYEILFNHGPLTGMELRRFLPRGFVDSQVRARLNELREVGVAHEVGKRKCSVTGMVVILWDVTNRLPVKYEKSKNIKCKSCNGRGYHVEQQARLF